MSKKSKLLIGTGLGIGLGLLFAPKKGSETRNELKQKGKELYNKIRSIDTEEAKENLTAKITELQNELNNLDKEKVKEIALEKIDVLKFKCEELVELAKEKGTPVVEKAADALREKAIAVTKDVLKKLENK